SASRQRAQPGSRGPAGAAASSARFQSWSCCATRMLARARTPNVRRAFTDERGTAASLAHGTNPERFTPAKKESDMYAERNVAEVERWASALSGAALAVLGIRQGIARNPFGSAMLAAAGGTLIY